MKKADSLKDMLYKNLLDDITRGLYPAGSIVTERMLTEKYQVSKTPVREALIQLCNEGIILNMPRYGYQVVQIGTKDIIDVLELRIILEISALEKTLPVISERQIDALQKNTEQAGSMANEKDILKHWEHNTSFHLLLCSFSGNVFFYEHLKQVLEFCARAASQYFRHIWNENKSSDGSNHRLLVELIRKKKHTEAKKLLVTDIRAFTDSLPRL
ncbi:GntR family transcriptional regulator [Treponema sp. HNW]|uniref:GntR family transcriptional regulator n=1 Tax=Treponema sp. HNW TaxID=3116654 RepID=UPI003D0E223D